jgi:uncharacterized membrane protein YqjE
MNQTADRNPLSTIALLRSAGGAIVAQASLHAQLARVEWAEEKARITRLLIAGMVCAVSALCLLISVGMFALALSWGTPFALPVMAAVLLFYLSLCGLAALVLKRQVALGALSFATTRQEIAADLALLRAKL